VNSYKQLPNHIAIIMDGNGRWAKSRGLNRTAGHEEGAKAVREITTHCSKIGVKYLTLYAFSTENWNRPKEEVDALMDLLVQSIANEVDELDENNIRLITIGDESKLPEDCQKSLMWAKEKTKNNKSLTLILALNYSARWEIIRALKEIAQEIENHQLKATEINEEIFDLFIHFINTKIMDIIQKMESEEEFETCLNLQKSMKYMFDLKKSTEFRIM
jgi:undecaprenyl diphosphate synthase